MALPNRTCDWSEGDCDVAVTNYSGGGYEGTRNCNGVYSSFSGSGSYDMPDGATCVNS